MCLETVSRPRYVSRLPISVLRIQLVRAVPCPPVFFQNSPSVNYKKNKQAQQANFFKHQILMFHFQHNIQICYFRQRKEIIFLPLSVCPPDYWKSYQRILMKFSVRVGCGSSNNWLDFGGGPDNDLNPEFFKGFFIYYCDSYRRPRIKHENPWLRFELPDYFPHCCLASREGIVLLTICQCVSVSVFTEPRLHEALVLAAKVMHCIQCYLFLAVMFWQETSFPENKRQTAYNGHTFLLQGEPDRAGPCQDLTLAGRKKTGSENFRQKMGRASEATSSSVIVVLYLPGSTAVCRHPLGNPKMVFFNIWSCCDLDLWSFDPKKLTSLCSKTQ